MPHDQAGLDRNYRTDSGSRRRGIFPERPNCRLSASLQIGFSAVNPHGEASILAPGFCSYCLYHATQRALTWPPFAMVWHAGISEACEDTARAAPWCVRIATISATPRVLPWVSIRLPAKPVPWVSFDTTIRGGYASNLGECAKENRRGDHEGTRAHSRR